jgi:hypothetical protein
MEQLSKKYPKSIYGKQCVGICYKKNTKIVHPIYSRVVTKLDTSFCPVAEFYEKENGKLIRKDIDECNENIQKKDYIFNDIDLLYPYVDFNSQIFLNICYNINNFSNGLQWIIDNNYKSIDTRERIFNLLIDAYSETIDIIEISDNRIVDFFNILIKSKYTYMLKKLFRYIVIEKDSVFIDEKHMKKTENIQIKEKSETNESIIIKTNYILKNIVTTNNITNFLSKYFKDKIAASLEKTYSEQMIEKFVIYLNDNIKKTFSK